jgi:hypothetical protein
MKDIAIRNRTARIEKRNSIRIQPLGTLSTRTDKEKSIWWSVKMIKINTMTAELRGLNI